MKMAFVQCDEKGKRLEDDLIFIVMDLDCAEQQARAMLAAIEFNNSRLTMPPLVGFPIKGKIEEYSKYAKETEGGIR